MAKNDVAVCNMALGHLGHSGPFITDFETDRTYAGELCSIYWEDARDVTLVEYEWPFATARKALARLANETRDEWRYAYALPEDCLEPRRIRIAGDHRRTIPAEDRIPFDVEKMSESEGQILLCDVADPILVYTARMEQVDKYPPKFALACSYKVAELIAIPLTGKKSDKDAMRQAFAIETTQAEGQAMRARQEDQPPETPSIRARR